MEVSLNFLENWLAFSVLAPENNFTSPKYGIIEETNSNALSPESY